MSVFKVEVFMVRCNSCNMVVSLDRAEREGWRRDGRRDVCSSGCAKRLGYDWEDGDGPEASD